MACGSDGVGIIVADAVQKIVLFRFRQMGEFNGRAKSDLVLINHIQKLRNGVLSGGYSGELDLDFHQLALPVFLSK